jgi:hypothetical protein
MCIHEYSSMALHIGAPGGVTFLEPENLSQEAAAEELNQELVAAEAAAVEDLPECPDHRATTFVKGKPRSM